MRPIRNLAIYFGCTFIGGALLAPWVYALTGALAPQAGWIAELADKPFHRYVNRSYQFMAVMGLWPFLRSVGADSWQAVGLVPMKRAGRQWLHGFVIGFISLALVVGLAMSSGARILKTYLSTGDIGERILGAAATALVVGFLEELLFRGTLFAALRRAHHWMLALGVSSLIYAFLHFLQKPPSPETVHWYSGVVTLVRMLDGLTVPTELVPGLFSLFLAGSILAYGYHRTGSLYFPIGLHAGWVFWLRSWGAVTMTIDQSNQWVWGTGKMYDGWLAFAVLASVLAGYIMLTTRRKHVEIVGT